jgi:hypothetical protein
MADITDNFENVFLTYQDIKNLNMDWSDRMIEDYLALKRDLLATATASEAIVAGEIGADTYSTAFINKLQAQVGSGNFLTSDETGFTVDSDRLSVDMDEA